MRPRNYAGVTGFMSRDEVDRVLCAMNQPPPPLTMVGVLASSKTIRGETNKYPRRYPTLDALETVFPNYHGVLNLIHFNTKQPEVLLTDMRDAQELCGPACDGFQLNVPWPEHEVLEMYRGDGQPEKRVIVLQCGTAALDMVGNDPVELNDRLESYEGLIDYVLVDPSGGKGLDFDLDFMVRCLDVLSAHLPESIGIGIAGGLHAQNLYKLWPLAERHGFRFSFDAEGNLRDDNDDLDINKASAYLESANLLLALME